MTSVLVGMFVCVVGAVLILLVVALPKFRSGEPLLSDEGERTVRRARRRAQELKDQARARAEQSPVRQQIAQQAAKVVAVPRRPAPSRAAGPTDVVDLTAVDAVAQQPVLRAAAPASAQDDQPLARPGAPAPAHVVQPTVGTHRPGASRHRAATPRAGGAGAGSARVAAPRAVRQAVSRVPVGRPGAARAGHPADPPAEHGRGPAPDAGSAGADTRVLDLDRSGTTGTGASSGATVPARRRRGAHRRAAELSWGDPTPGPRHAR